MDLRKGDCLIEMKNIPDKSVDFVYTDLPYGQTACKWDKKIDLVALWVELKRIAKSDRTPFFFSCTTRFGYELIKANEKWFRWDLVWKKNRAAGFLRQSLHVTRDRFRSPPLPNPGATNAKRFLLHTSVSYPFRSVSLEHRDTREVRQEPSTKATGSPP